MRRVQADYNFKILLLGDAAVGKTSLVQRFVHNRFAKSYLMTIGMEPSEKFVELENGTVIALSIWDLAGQERFRFIRHTFYKGAKAALLVFDLTRSSTLENIVKWDKEFTNHCGKDALKILVGNKSDLQDQIAVSDKECQSMNEQIGSKYYIPTSALTGEHVNDAFMYIAKQLFEKYK